MPDAVCVGDANGVHECNARVVEMLGLPSSKDLHRSIEELAKLIQLTAEMQPFTRALKGEAASGELLAALRHSNEKPTQFASVVSHDLQAPLRSIRSFTELLERKYKGRLDSRADEFIASIVDGTTRTQQLIRALLQYAQAGRSEYGPRAGATGLHRRWGSHEPASNPRGDWR